MHSIDVQILPHTSVVMSVCVCGSVSMSVCVSECVLSVSFAVWSPVAVAHLVLAVTFMKG